MSPPPAMPPPGTEAITISAPVPLTEMSLWIGALLLLCVMASKASSRFGVPSLLVFLGLGMLAGSDGPGGIPFSDASVAQAIGVVALLFIMFAGGLETHWGDVRPVAWQGVSLATLGVLVSTVLMGFLARYLLGTEWPEALLLGAMVSSTDAAALFSILKSQGIRLKGKLTPLLEFESGTNDPMAVFLTVGLVEFITEPNASVSHMLVDLFQEMVLGAVVGVVLGRVAAWMLNRRLPSDGLYPVLTVAFVFLTFGVATFVNGSGFLAVYLAGIVVAGAHFPARAAVFALHDGLGWLMQIGMFLVLGLLVFPSQLPNASDEGFVLALFLCFVARPASVFVSLALTKLDWREKVLLSWMGLRGAVPIILATFPLLGGVPMSQAYFNAVFFAVLTSVLLQGPTIPWLARKLNLQAEVK